MSFSPQLRVSELVSAEKTVLTSRLFIGFGLSRFVARLCRGLLSGGRQPLLQEVKELYDKPIRVVIVGKGLIQPPLQRRIVAFIHKPNEPSIVCKRDDACFFRDNNNEGVRFF